MICFSIIICLFFSQEQLETRTKLLQDTNEKQKIQVGLFCLSKWSKGSNFYKIGKKYCKI